MVKNIYAPKLAEILPNSIKTDDKIHAAAVALDAELEKMLETVKLTLHLPRLEELPSAVLDHLAYQFHCDFYSADLPDAVKRNQIRESIYWHRLKGTPKGVEKALSSFMTDARVEENWEYGGEPYFFRIVTRGLRYLSTEQEFIDLVNSAKNVRSWLEGIIFDLTIEEPQELVTAVAELESGKVTTEFAFEDKAESQNIACGFAELVSGKSTTYFGGREPIQRRSYYSAIAELNSGKISVMPENRPEPDEYWFERWIAEKWREWSKNPAIKYYTHPGDEIFPPDPDIFPDGDFLRLYFYFPNNAIRYLTLLNPREDLTAQDIRAAAVWFNDLLANRAGYSSVNLVKALLVRSERWRVF